MCFFYIYVITTTCENDLIKFIVLYSFVCVILLYSSFSPQIIYIFLNNSFFFFVCEFLNVRHFPNSHSLTAIIYAYLHIYILFRSKYFYFTWHKTVSSLFRLQYLHFADSIIYVCVCFYTFRRSIGFLKLNETIIKACERNYSWHY